MDSEKVIKKVNKSNMYCILKDALHIHSQPKVRFNT